MRVHPDGLGFCRGFGAKVSQRVVCATRTAGAAALQWRKTEEQNMRRIHGVWAIPMMAAGIMPSAHANTANLPVDVEHVDIHVEGKFASELRFSAVWQLRALGSARELCLATEGNALVSAAVDGEILPWKDDARLKRACLQHPQEWKNGRTHKLHLKWQSRFVQDPDPEAPGGSIGQGLRFFAPGAIEPRRLSQSWFNNEPSGLRRWLPHPQGTESDPLRSKICLQLPAPLRVVATGKPQRARGHSAHKERCFVQEQPVPLQRLGFVIGDFAQRELHADGIAVTQLYPDGQLQHLIDSSPRLEEMLGFYRELTGKPYPFTNLHQAFVQDHVWGHAQAGLAVLS
jgi:hypothetical protein